MSTATTGLVCAVCGTKVPLDVPAQWRCPKSTDAQSPHVLGFAVDRTAVGVDADHANPFLRHRSRLAVDAFGEMVGIGADERIAMIESLDARIADVAGTGFTVTPTTRQDALSDALGFTAKGGVWVKDETRNVAWSHKARHLFTEMLYLLMMERAGAAPWTDASQRPPLAIASCGNAAIAASTLARAVDWPIAVHVPVSVSDAVSGVLSGLEADVVTCTRRANDPAGDPCVLRFREKVAGGAVPFGVQGTENVWCLDGGRTIGWELADQWDGFDAVFVQVGGGAFATCLSAGLAESGRGARLHAVQTEGCAPLARAWRLYSEAPVDHPGHDWRRYMWPWESEPHSLADGILDDETYDWIGIVEQMARTGGSAVVASERDVVEAHRLANLHTTIDVSPTGSAGLAGVLASRADISDDDRVVVVFSGRTR